MKIVKVTDLNTAKIDYYESVKECAKHVALSEGYISMLIRTGGHRKGVKIELTDFEYDRQNPDKATKLERTDDTISRDRLWTATEKVYDILRSCHADIRIIDGDIYFVDTDTQKRLRY